MKTYGDYLAQIFPDIKVQKISIDAGFTCPNRDGTISKGGCSYCRNDSFSPAYCDLSESIEEQLEKGKRFFRRKYPKMKYLAYFQRYTGTHGYSLQQLEDLYRRALDCNDIVGLIIATRPDCLPEQIVELLAKLNKEKPVLIEIGAETSCDDTLRIINRNHTWADVEAASHRLHKAGLHYGLHLIAGLPGETAETVKSTVKKACLLPIETIKLHQLQILYNTPLFSQWQKREIDIHEFNLEEYLNLCVELIEIIPKHIVIERFLSQSPPEMVASPKWGLKNYQFMTKLAKLIEKHHEN